MPSRWVCVYVLHLRPEPFRMTHGQAPRHDGFSTGLFLAGISGKFTGVVFSIESRRFLLSPAREMARLMSSPMFLRKRRDLALAANLGLISAA
jgi:hypothetical protein